MPQVTEMFASRQIGLRRVVVWLLLGIGVLLFLNWGYLYLTTSRITIELSDKDSLVQITEVKENGSAGNTVFSGQAKLKQSARIKPGAYLVAVSGKSSFENRWVTPEARQHVQLSIALKNTVLPEPVYGGGAAGVIADQSQVMFIDATTGYLSQINSQGQLQAFDSLRNIKSVRGKDASFAVAATQDGRFYEIKDGVLSPLALPFKAGSNPSVSFDIAEGRVVYASNGQTVYTSSDSINYGKVYSSDKNYNLALYAGTRGVAIIEKSSLSGAASLVIADNTGEVGRKSIGEEQQVVWSPNGRLLAITNGRLAGGVYNSSLSRVSTLPKNLNSYAWLNNDLLVYSTGDKLWLHDLKTASSAAFASPAPGSTIKRVVASANTQDVYLEVETAGGKSIERVGLGRQKAPDFVYMLGVFLPVSLDTCTVTYTNFARPAIILFPYASGFAGTCEQEARASLTDSQIDVTKLNFFVGPDNAKD